MICSITIAGTEVRHVVPRIFIMTLLVDGTQPWPLVLLLHLGTVGWVQAGEALALPAMSPPWWHPPPVQHPLVGCSQATLLSGTPQGLEIQSKVSVQLSMALRGSVYMHFITGSHSLIICCTFIPVLKILLILPLQCVFHVQLYVFLKINHFWLFILL